MEVSSFPAQASHSTLETMWPWLSESELGDAIGDDARGKDVGQRTRAMVQAVKKWFDRMLTFSFKNKTPIVEVVPKTPEEIFQDLYALQKAAVEAEAAEAAARRAAITQAQLQHHFVDTVRDNEQAKQQGDAQIAHYEGFWAAVVARLDDVIVVTAKLDDSNNNNNNNNNNNIKEVNDDKINDDKINDDQINVDTDKGKDGAAQSKPSVVVTDTDAGNAQLRVKVAVRVRSAILGTSGGRRSRCAMLRDSLHPCTHARAMGDLDTVPAVPIASALIGFLPTSCPGL